MKETSDPEARVAGIPDSSQLSHHTLVDSLSDWLMRQALEESEIDDLAMGCFQRIYAAGIPIARAFLGYSTLHPLYRSKIMVWTQEDGIEVSHQAHSESHPEQFLTSPLNYMISNGILLMRRRLTGPGAMLDFPVLKDFRERGYTDWFGYLVSFESEEKPPSESSGMMGTWVTDRPSGFNDADLAALTRLQRALAVAMKVRIKDEIASNILSAYLGPEAGLKVLNGQIKRGDSECIPAIIWYSDLRNSTRLAEKLGAKGFMSLLNEYFECTAGAVIENGGEVLRFVGDAVLAIFPLRNGRGYKRAARNLRKSVDEALRRRQERWENGISIEFGIGLHIGEVLYGNIGVPSRLEFSVIGTSANEVARIEELTKKLKTPVLLSGELKETLDCDVVDLGYHKVKGVSRKIRLYTLPGAQTSQ